MIRVAVAEDDHLYRSSLELLFSVAPETTLDRVFADAADLCDHAQALADAGEPCPWDVVVMDMRMPRSTGTEGTRVLKLIYPSVRVMILTVYEDPPTILEAICAGVDGYLLKRSAVGSILAQVQIVASGGASLTPGVATTLLELMRRSPHLQPDRAGLDLTPREREVLQALVDGLSYKQVAAELDISIETVRSHVRKLYRKLQVHSVAEAVSKAIRDGLVA